MSKLILIRGLPGSGKSTIAKRRIIGEDFDRLIKHVEFDMYFISSYCEYKFNKDHLKDAHEWCLAATKMNLRKGYDVIVSNTFTQQWEMLPYINLGYDTEIIEATGKYKSSHNVPEDTIKRMADRWERITYTKHKKGQ